MDFIHFSSIIREDFDLFFLQVIPCEGPRCCIHWKSSVGQTSMRTSLSRACSICMDETPWENINFDLIS